MTTLAAIRATDPDWQASVLRFWYRDVQPPQWFIKDAAVDSRITHLFAALWEDLRQRPATQLAADAKGALASVLVLDQFPRNMFRGSGQSFASDTHALEVAERAIGLGLDRLLRKDERIFLYLPFEHSEGVALQARSVELISRLGNAEFTRYAHAHKAVVDRFGRFPHRNAALGRPSTADEAAFLATPGSGF